MNYQPKPAGANSVFFDVLQAPQVLAELKVFADCRPYPRAPELDVAKHHPDAARRNRASRWTSLVTPVLKAAWNDQACHGASACLHVLGGHGYVSA